MDLKPSHMTLFKTIFSVVHLTLRVVLVIQTIGFLYFYVYALYSTLVCRPSDSTVSEDAGIEHRTVATLALAVSRSSHSATSHPLFVQISQDYNKRNHYIVSDACWTEVERMQNLLSLPGPNQDLCSGPMGT
jgi:hypothetical protein